MVRVARTAWRWLDSFFRGRSAGLRAFAFAVVFGMVPLAAHAEQGVPDYSTGMADCQAFESSTPASTYGGTSWKACYVQWSTYQNHYEVYADILPSGTHMNGWIINDGSTVPPTGCAAVTDGPGTQQAISVAASAGAKICDTTASSGVAGYPACVESFTPGTGIANAQGGFVVAGTWHATGTACVQNSDGTFTPDGTSTPASPPTSYAAKGQTPQKSCGGGSCVDPTSGKACINDQSGAQYCTPAGSALPPAAPNCYSDGSSATLCVGSPSPTPPNPPVTDPAKQIASSDTYNVSTSTSSSLTTVNVYNLSGGTTSSGQGTTDSGPAGGGTPQGTNPAHASSAGGNGTLSGGTDCNSPPVCTGDSVLCGIARTQWATTCQVHRDIAGTGTPPASSSSVSASALWTDGTATGDSAADAANQGNYDTSGFGFAQDCPLQDLTITLAVGSFDVPFSKGCVVGQWIKGVVLAFAMLAAAKITAGGTK